MTTTNPHMYYWTKDELGHEWRILLVGIYEEYEDGNNIVSELDVAEYYLVTDNEIYPPSRVPDEIVGFAEVLMDDPTTYLEIRAGYESEGRAS